MAKLASVEGIGAVYAGKLQESGIRTTGALLKAGASPQGREEIAEKAGISPKLVLEWVNHVDLFRIKGVGEEYADLLEEAGVDTVPELAQRNAENLYAKLKETNAQKDLVRQLPGARQVEDWITQAKALPRVVTY
jgi:predicted flap endonuclease-1-like 5' DNA nuclease